MLDLVDYEPASGEGCVTMWRANTDPDGKISNSQIANPVYAKCLARAVSLRSFRNDSTPFLEGKWLVSLIFQFQHFAAFILVSYPAFEGAESAASRVTELLPVILRPQRFSAQMKQIHPPATGGINTTESPSASETCQSLNSSLTATLSWPGSGKG